MTAAAAGTHGSARRRHLGVSLVGLAADGGLRDVIFHPVVR